MSTTSKKTAKTVVKRPILKKNGQKVAKKAPPAKKATPKVQPKKAAVKKPAIKKAVAKPVAAKKAVTSKLTKPVAKIPQPIKKAPPLKNVKAEAKATVKSSFLIFMCFWV